MNPLLHTRLDNPVWHSLNEVHEKFAITFVEMKCYHPDYCPFGGNQNKIGITEGMDAYAKLTDNFFIVGENPGLVDGFVLKKNLVCLQMILDHQLNLDVTEEIIRLNGKHDRELFDLVNLVQPGYFKSKTTLLGDYFGIFKNGNLVAVTGERMKMNDFTELSAIVTHPGHTGKGYAKQLIAHVANKIFNEGKTPYLHVAETNSPAVTLYQKLGFTTRRKISFFHFSTQLE